jgi:Domain of unknown function (DUF5054)
VSSLLDRRNFLLAMLATGGTLASSSLERAWGMQSTQSTAAQQVRRVLAIFKCHFDAGFIDTQQHVVQKYFQVYFPAAIRVAREQREQGRPRYTWTTGSWLLYEYLEQASKEDRQNTEKAILDGDLAWHALPFSWQTELMDDSQITGSVALSRFLDARFGKKTNGAKMTDVPGHTRGLITPLSAGGVTFLDIGVNGASRTANVPPFFLWKDSRGASVTVMYHHGYGGVTQVPNSDLAIATIVRGDNSGPHTPAEIESIYGELKQRFPNAEVIATGLGEIAEAVEPHRADLPVVTQEIGDTWIYGAPSDPIKVARYREISRLRNKWIQRGEFQCGDKTDLAVLANLLLETEHTWGTDTKTWLDFENYKPSQLAAMLPTKNYQVVAYSWKEKRDDLSSALATLPVPLQKEAQDALATLTPHEPSTSNGYNTHSGDEIESKHFHLQIDPTTGAIHRLLSKASGLEWASPQKPLGLIAYQALSSDDYDRFLKSYIISKADWAPKDFGKPNIDRVGAISKTWHPTVDKIYTKKSSDGQSIIIESRIRDSKSLESGLASFPKRFYFEISLPDAEPTIALTLSWFGKPATRLPESLWLTFNPVTADDAQWTFEKCSEPVSPHDVVRGGGRHMHGLSSGFSCRSGDSTLFVDTVDAPVVALGDRSPLNFSQEDADLSQGVHCNLYNNAWGTNYIQWFGEDCRLRFLLRESQST